MQTASRSVEPQPDYRFVERTACPVCRSPKSAILLSQSFQDAPIGPYLRRHYGVDAGVLGAAPYELAECGNCGLIYQGWVGDDGLLTGVYERWVENHDLPDNAIYQAEMRAPLQSRDGHEIITASRFLGVPLKDMATLDYGMGWALWARIARHLGCQSFGTDLASSRMAFAKSHGVEIEIANRRFHFINTEQVMEHLVDPAGVAEQLVDALLPGGILKISVPSGEAMKPIIADVREGRGSDYFEQLIPVHPLEHVNCFTKRTLKTLAEKYGLRIVKPSLVTRYAFLTTPGAISPLRPAKAAKELVRPIYQWRNPANLYVWMQKPL